MMNVWVTVALMWIGAAFMLIAAIGIARLPDTFTRLQAATKAVTLGMASMMLAAATYFADVGVTVRALTTLLFLFATAPIAAHLIGRVAYFVGSEMWEGTQFDELHEQHAKGQRRGTPPAPPGNDRSGEPRQRRSR